MTYQERQQQRANALEVLEKAKKQISERVANGERFISIDSKTKILKKAMSLCTLERRKAICAA